MEIKFKQLIVAACLVTAVAVTGLTGCHTSGRTTGTYIDDRMVASRVKGALNDAPIYKFPNVDVNSFNGSVQLNGFVASPEQKQQAAQIASRVEGVRQLINNITVQPMSPTGRTNSAPIYNSDNNPPMQPPPASQTTPMQPQQ
ncbi:MAG: transporter [Pedosphaera sp.]|nr:transporter [Pedosphaera sp.]